VHDSDDAGHAVHLVRRTALAESIATMDSGARQGSCRLSHAAFC
jgi:hypothetical protein